MARVKLGISGLSIPDKIQVCAEIVSKMAGNEAFQNPVPKLADVGDAINLLSKSYQAAVYRDKLLKAAMRLADESLSLMMVQLAAYVQTASNGNEGIILTSGMQVVKRKSPAEAVETPVNLKCLHTDKEGEAPLRWKRVKGARMYYVQVSQQPEDDPSWKDLGKCTKTRFTVTGLVKGQDYWFRVCAGGALGDSGWSDPAKRLVS